MCTCLINGRSQSSRLQAVNSPLLSTPASVSSTEIAVECRDGYVLHGHLWTQDDARPGSTVIINPATGVLARYYHHLARFLVEHGFTVITYDYRGIGASRPPRLKGSAIRWRDWGEYDFDAIVRWARKRDAAHPLLVIGHSIGGFLPGFAAAAPEIDRMLTVGAQYAYYRDYAPARRTQLVLKWHIAMPLLTWASGYFPGRRLGWLEDLPAGVAAEWSFRRAAMETNYPRRERAGLLARFAAVRAPILAVATTDDDFATPSALRRTLDYYRCSDRSIVVLKPADLGHASIGHFGLFHARHRDDFWQALLVWLRQGTNPWPTAVIHHAAAQTGDPLTR